MPYFIIDPDYGACLGSFRTKDSFLSYGCDDDTIELEGYDDTPFVVPGIEEWCYQLEDMNYKYIHNELPDASLPEDPTLFGRGLALAQAFRQILPDEINLYYLNRELIKKINYFRIMPDVLSIIGFVNGVSEIYEKEEISIGYFPSIELPGVDKWWNDFDSRVDYADATADTDFDWVTWIIKGLEMAKVIRNRLPQSVAVWFSTPFELRNVINHLDVLINLDGSFKIEEFHT
jgi:hypothetical protein